MSLKRERERDLSPTNCSSAATGVSRGYGQDLRRFFFYFFFSIFFLSVGACCSLIGTANGMRRVGYKLLPHGR